MKDTPAPVRRSVSTCQQPPVLCQRNPLTQRTHADAVTQAPPDAVLIVDGVFAFRPELDDLWEYRIWVEVAVYLAEADPLSRVDATVDNTEFRRPRLLAR
ncbi:hypothetical protein JNW91_23865 [Micromonospora sp. STR1_7]|uniref:Uridine kinase n=1 Tax=Micromonospora parastrephiae TaxID=2806101 RepID=A0ABS1XZA5_9ACTN|nr:hypothetical protein [Micromonospora parastrephiae]MBM0234593.1 hypothetical protein [Micromonospora parastrephiae]